VADRCRKSHAEVARRRRSELLDLAREAALADRLPDADRYGELAWRLTTRYELEASPRLKRRVCRNCRAYLVPDRTARVRIQGGSVTTVCEACGRERRIPLDER
jgi:ribonuclease P protein subunit RPR2